MELRASGTGECEGWITRIIAAGTTANRIHSSVAPESVVMVNAPRNSHVVGPSRSHLARSHVSVSKERPYRAPPEYSIRPT
jgi:hypothetical protein